MPIWLAFTIAVLVAIVIATLGIWITIRMIKKTGEETVRMIKKTGEETVRKIKEISENVG